jgi:hypothetical protein
VSIDRETGPLTDLALRFSATRALASSLAIIPLSTRSLQRRYEDGGQEQCVETDQNDRFDSMHRRFSLNDSCDGGKAERARSLGAGMPAPGHDMFNRAGVLAG